MAILEKLCHLHGHERNVNAGCLPDTEFHISIAQEGVPRVCSDLSNPNMALLNNCKTIAHFTRCARRSMYSIWPVGFGHYLHFSNGSPKQPAKERLSTIKVEDPNKSQNSNSYLKSDVVIIGGGACGVAVAAQIVQLVKKGKILRSIALVEKSKSAGPGLAYSDACIGTILNMQAKTMGIYADDPEHFTRWTSTHFPSLKETSFPPRHIYGLYLSSVLDGLKKYATQNGVLFRVVNDEAMDINPVGQDLEVLLARGTRIETPNVVLALGNFLATLHPELIGSPGFFSAPWPLERLKVIPSDASVSILGAGLTAIDAAIFLVENGHRGKLTFISRNGRLPKVQGIASPFQRRYILHSLARDVESSDGDALSKVISTIQREIESLDGDRYYDWSDMESPEDPLAEF